MLLACVGLPYFLLSATSPLVQTWFAHTNPGKSPYRLYALSNVGSLGALVLYPFAIEPSLGTGQQGWLWSAGFVVYVVVSAVMGWQLRTRAQGDSESRTQAASTISDQRRPVTWLDRAVWLGLPTLASMMLLAVTNHVCQDVAVVPFCGLHPWASTLVSLIICFDRDRWYKPMLFALGAIIIILFACDMAFMAYIYQNSTQQPRFVIIMKYDIRLLLTVYLSLFFFGCMLCHGEVVRRRPAPERLTEFYLTISAGGALGGILVAILCPLIFVTFAELKIGIVLTFALAVVVLLRQLGVFQAVNRAATKKATASTKKRGKSLAGKLEPVSQASREMLTPTRYLLCFTGVLLVGVVISAQALVYDSSHTEGPKTQLRNFYGALTVRDWYPTDDPLHGRALYHGTILHGYQFLTPEKELKPTTYYTEGSGVGLTLQALRGEQPIKVGAVGLGSARWRPMAARRCVSLLRNQSTHY